MRLIFYQQAVSELRSSAYWIPTFVGMTMCIISMIYRFWGKVKKGKGRGKDLGFPTANINLHKKIPEGVYLSQTFVNRKQYNSITFIGNAKTFNEKLYQAESLLLDYSGNLYGKYISVNLFKKIRGNMKFKSVKDLVNQIKEDKKVARECFSKAQDP